MLSKVLLSFALTSAAVAGPVAHPEFSKHLWVRQDANSCKNQSCEVAAVSGSTGKTVYDYPSYPTGDTQDGDCCIVRYFPAAKNAIYAERPGLQSYCASHGGDAPLDSNPPGVNSVSVVTPAGATPAPSASSDPLGGLLGLFGRQASCKPYTLIYAKGTFEIGDFGQTLGPQIQQGLDASKWDVTGVEYDNSLDNDYCLGLPGGVSVRGVLNQKASACPNTKIVLAGYSQGAMTVRHAIARAPSSQVAQIKSVLTFGDPFCGAQIGQYSGPIHVYCIDGDGVCNGQLDITLQHLSYGMDVTPGVNQIKSDVGDS